VTSIIREGKRQRFCQQCGRFHDLTCFDGDKRSCRARLQRHNARRRKKPADSGGGSKPPPGVKKPPTPLARRGSRDFVRTDSSKQRQTSESTLVGPSKRIFVFAAGCGVANSEYQHAQG
jgi:hypothetical protein